MRIESESRGNGGDAIARGFRKAFEGLVADESTLVVMNDDNQIVELVPGTPEYQALVDNTPAGIEEQFATIIEQLEP